MLASESTLPVPFQGGINLNPSDRAAGSLVSREHWLHTCPGKREHKRSEAAAAADRSQKGDGFLPSCLLPHREQTCPALALRPRQGSHLSLGSHLERGRVFQLPNPLPSPLHSLLMCLGYKCSPPLLTRTLSPCGRAMPQASPHFVCSSLVAQISASLALAPQRGRGSDGRRGGKGVGEWGRGVGWGRTCRFVHLAPPPVPKVKPAQGTRMKTEALHTSLSGVPTPQAVSLSDTGHRARAAAAGV